MMARFDRNVPRPRLLLLRPQQVLLLLGLLAGMAVRTGANMGCSVSADGEYHLSDAGGKCPIPEINAAFGGELTSCSTQEAYENDHLHSWQQIQAGSLADCQTTAANMNNYPGYEGADLRCWDTRFPVRGTLVVGFGIEGLCEIAVKSIQRILAGIKLCANVTCLNRGTCSATKTLDDYVCTCNAPDLGGGWVGKDCELCNGAQPPIDPAANCDGITLAECAKNTELQHACPTTCGMCFTSTTSTTVTTSTTTTTGLCKGNPDPSDCGMATGTVYNVADCGKDNYVGNQAKLTCPVMCGTCVMPTTTSTTTGTATPTTTTAMTTTETTTPATTSPTTTTTATTTKTTTTVTTSATTTTSTTSNTHSATTKSTTARSTPTVTTGTTTHYDPAASPTSTTTSTATAAATSPALKPTVTTRTPLSPAVHDDHDKAGFYETLLIVILIEPLGLAITSILHWRHIHKGDHTFAASRAAQTRRKMLFKTSIWWLFILTVQISIWMGLVAWKRTNDEKNDADGYMSWSEVIYTPGSCERAHIAYGMVLGPVHIGILLYGIFHEYYPPQDQSTDGNSDQDSYDSDASDEGDAPLLEADGGELGEDLGDGVDDDQGVLSVPYEVEADGGELGEDRGDGVDDDQGVLSAPYEADHLHVGVVTHNPSYSILESHDDEGDKPVTAAKNHDLVDVGAGTGTSDITPPHPQYPVQ